MRKFIDVVTETVFGTLWTRPGLDLKTRTLVTLVSDAATGRLPELAIHLRMALRQGWTEEELTEVLIHLHGLRGRAAHAGRAADGARRLRGGEEGSGGVLACRDSPARYGTTKREEALSSRLFTHVFMAVGALLLSARYRADADPPAAGALVRTTMSSTVGVLLDEIPKARSPTRSSVRVPRTCGSPVLRCAMR